MDPQPEDPADVPSHSAAGEVTPYRLPADGYLAITAFVVIVIGMGLPRLAMAGDLSSGMFWSITLIGSFAPLVAALVVVATTTGRDGLRDLGRRLAHWRVRPGWYLLGLAVPVLVYGAVLIAYLVASGNRLDTEIALLAAAEVVVLGPLLVVVEETGWRGWLQRAMQARVGGLTVALLVGAAWLGWHVPLLYIPDTAQSELSLVPYSALLISVAVVFAWVFNATGGSVLAVVAAHLGFNLGIGPATLALDGGAHVFVALCALVTVLIAVILIVVTQRGLALPPARRRIE